MVTIWLCTEDLSNRVSDELAKKLGYRIFSCRTGNIYTTSMLNQWVDWSLNKQVMPQEIWQYKKRYYDPMRPTVENASFETLEECLVMRERARLVFFVALNGQRFRFYPGFDWSLVKALGRFTLKVITQVSKFISSFEFTTFSCQVKLYICMTCSKNCLTVWSMCRKMSPIASPNCTFNSSNAPAISALNIPYNRLTKSRLRILFDSVLRTSLNLAAPSSCLALRSRQKRRAVRWIEAI